MKESTRRIVLALCCAVLAAAGCSKEESSSSPPAASSPPPPPSSGALPSADQVTDAAKSAADQAKAELDKAASTVGQKADSVVKTATEAVAAGSGQIEKMIDTAKRLTGDKKYDEALKILGDLLKEKLSPAQQTLVNGLKAQVEQQMKQAVADKAVGEAGKAAEGLLKRK
jgi:hypothetical protein